MSNPEGYFGSSSLVVALPYRQIGSASSVSPFGSRILKGFGMLDDFLSEPSVCIANFSFRVFQARMKPLFENCPASHSRWP